MTDEESLEDAKRRFIQAKTDIEAARQRIALRDCPLHVGDKLSVEDNGQSYVGVVERIDPVPNPTELLGPELGAASGWAVSGHRIRKGDGQRSKWTFGFTSFTGTLEGGIWVLRERGIEAMLGLAKYTVASADDS